jgi:peptidoglycan/xylan/chitin deacetylase (PgdA/CDA1 family)/Ca2+-binding RTX toxin-like protein
MALISGTVGNDILLDLIGNDALTGMSGADTYVFKNGNGADYILDDGDASAAILDTIRLDSWLATGVLFYRSGTDLVVDLGNYDSITIGDQYVAGSTSRIEQIVDSGGIAYTMASGLAGATGNDIVVATSANETVTGNAGNDILFGGDGNDSLDGGTGNDVLYGGTGNDLLAGNAGIDTASYADTVANVIVSLATTLAQNTGGAGTDTLQNIENLAGGQGNDTLTGNASANTLDGGLGNDTLSGAGGNDTLLGGGGNDVLIGGAGNDSLNGGAGNDIYRYTATTFSGDVGAGQIDTIMFSVGDQLDFTSALEKLMKIGGVSLSAAAANVTVGTTFAVGTNVRYTGGQLQIDVNGDRIFSATQDFAVTLGVNALQYDAASDTFVPKGLATKHIALTFDDGPDPTFTPLVLSALASFNVHATFFVVGEHVNWFPNLVADIHNAGHMIGNHTFDHQDLTTLSDAAIQAELLQTSDAIFNVIGERPVYVRPPYGAYDARVDADIAAMGFKKTMWTVDTQDWQQHGVDSIIQRALSGAANDGVILMHDAGGDRSQTVAALYEIIPRLLAQGYDFVTMDGILNRPTTWDNVIP